MKNEVFSCLCCEKLNAMLDEKAKNDNRCKSFYMLINRLYKTGKINFDEFDILESSQFLYFDLFEEILDDVPEIVLKF